MACKCSKSTKLWISSILVIIIISALTLFAYTGSQDALRDSVRTGLKNTAGVMATQVNASDIANLKPGDEMSPKYLAVVNNLWTMRSMNDQIINAYILKVNPDHSITFLVDDLYPLDPQGSARPRLTIPVPARLATPLRCSPSICLLRTILLPRPSGMGFLLPGLSPSSLLLVQLLSLAEDKTKQTNQSRNDARADKRLFFSQCEPVQVCCTGEHSSSLHCSSSPCFYVQGARNQPTAAQAGRLPPGLLL